MEYTKSEKAIAHAGWNTINIYIYIYIYIIIRTNSEKTLKGSAAYLYIYEHEQILYSIHHLKEMLYFVFFII